MNLGKLLEYDFARNFVEGRLSENGFLQELIKRVDTDRSFRENTGIISLETKDLNDVIRKLKVYSQRKFPTRRGFINTIAAGFSSIFVLKNRGATASENQKQFSAKQLYLELQKIPSLKPEINPIFSENPTAPLIILLQDVHGDEDKITGWRTEYNQLEELRNRFEYNFVGIEGWAGHEIDKKRGRLFLNAEKLLIKALMNNENYEVVGLEDEFLQIHTYEVGPVPSMPLLYQQHFCLYRKIHNYLLKNGFGKNDIEKFFDCALESINKRVFKTTETRLKCIGYMSSRKNIENLEHDFKFGSDAEFYLRTLNTIYEMFEWLYGIQGINERLLSESMNEIKNKARFLFQYHCESLIKDDFPPAYFKDIKFEKYYDLVCYHLRNRFAVSKMISSMNILNKKVGLVIFGKGHTEGLIKEFQKQVGDINIIVLVKHPEIPARGPKY